MSWVFFREQNPICHGNKNKKLRNSRYVISTFPQEGNYIIMEKLFVYNILMSNSMIPNDDVQLMRRKTRRPTQMNNRSLVKNTSILSTLRHKRSFCGDSFHFITLLSYQTNILWSLEMKEILRVSLKLMKTY